MKKLLTFAVAALMVLAAVGAASAAITVDSVEIRGPIYNGSNINNIVATYGNGDYVEVTATNFAGFWYDIDENDSTEVLRISNARSTGERELAEEYGLTYITYINDTAYEGFEGNYNIIGFFAEPYVPLTDSTPDKLAKLMFDDDEKYTLRVGESLDLGNGYKLTAKQVDVDGKQVWMEVTKDGEFLDDNIFDLDNTEYDVWTYEEDVGGEDDVTVMKVNVTSVFQGQTDSLAQIEGLWMIDWLNYMEIDSDDERGELERTESSSTDYLKYYNTDDISLDEDETIDLGEGLSIKVADDSDALRFYVMKEYTEPGTYEVRGSVATGNFIWNATNFAGFWYDLDDNQYTESLIATTEDDRELAEEDGLTYITYINDTAYEGFEGNYNIIGFFAEQYVPLTDSTPDKLAKLMFDDDEKYTLRVGESLDLGNGYKLTAKQVDVDGKQVWMEVTKDGEFLDDNIFDLDNTEGYDVWTYEEDVGGEDDVTVMKVNVTSVFQGQTDSLAQIEGLWMIDWLNYMEIDSDDERGELERTESSSTKYLKYYNTGDISLDEDETIHIAGEMYFKTADNSTLRYYPFVEMTIEGDETTQPDEEDEVDDEPVGNETDGNETEPVEPVEPVDPSEPADNETEPPVDGEEEPGIPGFEAVLAIGGLLAVAYLVRRN